MSQKLKESREIKIPHVTYPHICFLSDTSHEMLLPGQNLTLAPEADCADTAMRRQLNSTMLAQFIK